MSREWKPGDVAASDHQGISIVVPKCDRHFANGPHWHHRDGGWDQLHDPMVAGRFRPLVVIDPEDRRSIEALRDLWDAHYAEQVEPLSARERGDRGNALQAALREFTDPKPPKPEEPTGLGAVVEDADGYLWIRSATSGRDPWRAEGAREPNRRTFHMWSDIDAVKVLSEGVTP